MAQNDRVHHWDHTDITGYTLLLPCICLLGLGEKWAPAVINSASEWIFIREIQKRFGNSLSYWIGGSTYARDGLPVTFYEYMPDLKG